MYYSIILYLLCSIPAAQVRADKRIRIRHVGIIYDVMGRSLAATLIQHTLDVTTANEWQALPFSIHVRAG